MLVDDFSESQYSCDREDTPAQEVLQYIDTSWGLPSWKEEENHVRLVATM